MSVRQLSTDTRIALAAAAAECGNVVRLGGTPREAIEQSTRVFNEIMSFALKNDGARECRS
jgi:hypothetical protein